MTEHGGEKEPCSFEAAWRAKAAWGAHALQHPCECSLVAAGRSCSTGEALYRDYYRLANIANGALSGRTGDTDE